MADVFLMEVCVDSVESAVNAERGGAGRLELCCSLMEGGLTPSVGLLQVVKRYVKIPVYVMIRPRGGDFLYSDQEVEVMRKDMEVMKNHGADGFVLGALTEDGRVDAELCMEFLAAARPLPVTFHRAFDMVHDAAVALETLVSLGFQRVLTSGCDNSALEGLPLIKRLVDQAKGRITIMPGGGITERNLQRILEGSGAQEFHCSARSSRDSAMKFRNNSVTMGASLSAPEYSLKDPKHTSKSTSEWLKKNKMKPLEWPSQSPDLNPIEMLWLDLKKTFHAGKPSNVAELQQFCKDEWAKIPPQRCKRFIASYRKRLIAVVAAKGGPTSY
ncbi:copper homeostasis protein cutC homolog isoform X1 [Dunckerocampus dactyliophorus]|uniref:copper homeostasis protein cutC homolog isoform X1 n=1 Tax=Dunckerocampus dactyliophorus TaxID=161453 RepID=UPI002406F7C1|nr:copper homeostasis protein cutC homolog isoform X1 [Dunckerocampus dactyliophorus]